MQITAKVISDATFEEWSEFFDSYKQERSQFVTNELVESKRKEAKVSFEITDLEGLTKLSSSPAIISKEEELGVVTEILWFFITWYSSF